MSRRWRPAYVGVGSNLDSPAAQLRDGIDAIGRYPDSRLVLQSPFYRSAPMGPQDQPDFVNAVVALVTQLDPLELLGQLQATEAWHGRDRSAGRWGPRTLDLDLLAVSDIVIDADRLVLPHPGIAARNFVLLPWRDIAPWYHVPGLGPVWQLAAAVPSEPAIKKED